VVIKYLLVNIFKILKLFLIKAVRNLKTQDVQNAQLVSILVKITDARLLILNVVSLILTKKCGQCYPGYILSNDNCVVSNKDNLCAQWKDRICVKCGGRAYFNDQGGCSVSISDIMLLLCCCLLDH